MAHKKPVPQAPLARTWPLASEQEEAFVREYLDSYDGPRAALKAGYEDPHLVWQDLLDKEDVRERLRGQKGGTDVPAHSASAISGFLLKSALSKPNPTLIPDIMTGRMRPNWQLIEQQDAPFVEYEETIQNRGGIEIRTTRLRKRATFDATKLVAAQLETLVQHAGNSGDSMAQAILEINRRGSAAPIRRARKSEDPPETT